MVIAASQVPRWLQPAPNLTVGEAIVVFTGDPDLEIPAYATALADITGPVAVAVEVDGTAPLLYDDDLEFLTAVDAAAEVVFDNTAAVEDDLGVAACIALADITATCLLDTQLDGNAPFVVFGTVEGAPVLSADAEIGFADYGQGSIPVFPFTLPVLFTDNPYGFQTAEAFVTVTGDGFDIQGGAFADAIVAVDTPGEFSQKGNTPIFPFAFPIVFTDSANDKAAIAIVSITTPCALIADLGAEASVGITATALQANPAVFPWTLPVVLAA